MVYYPTSPLVLQQIFFMANKLTKFELDGGIYLSMVKPMKEKLKKYFEKMTSVITCAVALNSCFNVSWVELLIETISTNLKFFDDSHATKAKQWFNESLEGLYNLYYTKYGNPTTQPTSGASSSGASSGNQMTNLLNKLKNRSNKRARNGHSLTSEYERITWTQERKQHTSNLENALDFEEEILDAEVLENEAIPLSDEEITLDAASQELLIETISMNLKFFDDSHATKAKKWFNESLEGLYNLYYTKYDNPTTQPTSGASSSGAISGNQMTNLLNKLKDRSNKRARNDRSLTSEYERITWTQERKQHTSNLENALDFEEEILDAEVLENEAIPLSDEEITLDAASQGSGGEEFDYDMTNLSE
nr:hypothetical protein [Tanacetum cinerariifolium]